MTDRRIILSRRQLLGGLVTLGSASAAAGAGTFAVFSDSERAEASVTAGSLDLEIVARNGSPVDGDSGTVTFLDGTNVLPGDSGTATVTLKNTGTLDGFLDLTTVRLIDDGNGLTDPESEVDDSDGEAEGELAEALDVSVALSSRGTTQYLCPVFDGGTASLAATFQEGETYDLDYALASGQELTFELSWSLPSDTGNEIQGDSAGIELDFQLEQNKDDTGRAVCPVPEDDSDSSEDEGDGSESGLSVTSGDGHGREAIGGWDWTTFARFGTPEDSEVTGNSEPDNYEVGVLKKEDDDSDEDSRVHEQNGHWQHAWSNGASELFTVTYDGSKVSTTIGGTTYPNKNGIKAQGVGSANVTDIAVTVTVTDSAYGAELTNVELKTNGGSGISVGAVAEDGETGGLSQYLWIDGSINGTFELTGDLTFEWDGESSPSGDDIRVQVDVKTTEGD